MRIRSQFHLYISFGIALTFFVLIALTAAFGQDHRTVVWLSGAALAVCGCIFWVVIHTVSRPLAHAMAISRRMAAGDLTETSEISAQGKGDELLDNLRNIGDKVFDVVTKIRMGTTSIATTSRLLASDNAALSSRTESQAAALEETASSMEELMSTVKQNAENAKEASCLAVSAAESAAKGSNAIGNVIDTMSSIRDSARRVADITGVIDGIAFQTNILALNAAVEAARAGEEGRGFAVVAAEVRNLAQRSAVAAREIKALVGESVETVNAGSSLVDEAGFTMQEVVTSIKHLADLMNEIASASREQSSGIAQISDAVTQIDQTTQQNTTLVVEASKGAAYLNRQAITLTQAVAVFKLGSREFGSPDEAVAMVQRAVEYAKHQGTRAVIADVNLFDQGRFIDRDLYLLVYAMSSLECVGYGTNPRLVGADGSRIKDASGRYFVKEMIDIARSKGSGWVSYQWEHPVTQELLAKSTYFERIQDVVIACGCYKS